MDLLTDQEELQRQEATHELIDGEVNKVDLVDRPATGDLWLVVRSADEAQTIVDKGDWNMPGQSAPKRRERTALSRDEAETQDDQSTVDVSEEDSDETAETQAETVTRIGGERSNPKTEVLTRETVSEVISQLVPSMMADTLRELGLVPAATESDSSEEAVARAGAKMSSGRLKRLSGALSKFQEGLSELGDLHRELSGSDEVERSETTEDPKSKTVDTTPGLVDQMRGLFDKYTTKIENKLSEVSAELKKDVKRLDGRVDKVNSALGKPSTEAVDDTKEVKRSGEESIFRDIVHGPPTTRRRRR